MLDSLEQKLKHYEQSIFGMQEYIESKVRETDFQSKSAEPSTSQAGQLGTGWMLMGGMCLCVANLQA